MNIFDISKLKLLGKGMQSTVYEFNDNQVLKVYGKEIGIDNIKRLKSFYESLNISDVDFITPLILEINENESNIFLIEKRLEGICPNIDYLKELDTDSLKEFLRNYVDTLFSIQKIQTSLLNPFEPLDKVEKFFNYQKYKSWSELINKNLIDKYEKSKVIFNNKVNDVDNVIIKLTNRIESIKVKENLLIHGDYFPANLMIDSEMNILSVLDFGILTTIGDPLFDIALGWMFSDMYDQVKSFKIKEYVKELIKERLNNEEFERLYIYVLVYSFMSANMYATNDPNEGHFNWCIGNLNSDDYKKYLEK